MTNITFGDYYADSKKRATMFEDFVGRKYLTIETEIIENEKVVCSITQSTSMNKAYTARGIA